MPFGIDNESYLFHLLSQHRDEISNLMSRRQYNGRRKFTAGLCEVQLDLFKTANIRIETPSHSN